LQILVYVQNTKLSVAQHKCFDKLMIIWSITYKQSSVDCFHY